MISRRESLGLGLAVGFGLAGGTITSPIRAQSTSTAKTPVAFDVPPGACDCHVHVFPDPVRFPFWSGRVYTPPVATADDLLAFQKSIGFDRLVLVTTSVYDTDNSSTLDGLRQLGSKRARGIAVIGESTTKAELATLDEAGVRGVRVNLEVGGVTDAEPAKRILDGVVRQIRDRGWHLQVYARLPLVAALQKDLESLPMPVVFDHFAGVDAARGVNQPGFDSVVNLVRSGKAYVKISAAYRASKLTPDYPDVTPFAQLLVKANPDRILWASGWPHANSAKHPGRKPTDIAPALPIDDGGVLNLLAGWVPDKDVRRKILVDNPAKLYGF